MLLSQSECFRESPGILGVGIHWTNQMKLELGRQLLPDGFLPIWKKSHVYKSDRQNEKSKANFLSLLSFLILFANPPREICVYSGIKCFVVFTSWLHSSHLHGECSRVYGKGTFFFVIKLRFCCFHIKTGCAD